LFAGAEIELLSRLDNRATGVAAKLCLLTASMIGEANDIEAASKFYLLDADRSCIPNAHGIVMSGRRPTTSREAVTNDMLRPYPAQSSYLQAKMKDFTVHIEPDLGRDNQSCLLVYRDNGRIVHRLSPADCDTATVLTRPPEAASRTDQWKDIVGTAASSNNKDQVLIVPLEKFHGCKVVIRGPQTDAIQRWAATGVSLDWLDKPIFIPTRNLPRARTCIKAVIWDSLEWIGHTPKERYRLHADLEGAYVLYDEEARPIVIA
jgi:hypothetical protein